VLLSTIHLNVRREISLVPLGHYGNCNLSKMPDATRVKQRTRETTAAVARCREPRDQPPQEGTPHPEVKTIEPVPRQPDLLPCIFSGLGRTVFSPSHALRSRDISTTRRSNAGSAKIE
jgi:hypothetical protein